MTNGITVVTAATREPVSLQEVRDHCRIDSSLEDGLIAGYIMAARSHIELLTGRVFAPQTLEFSTDSFQDSEGEDEICLPICPVQSIVSITYIDQAGVTQTLSPGAYAANLKREPVEIEPVWGSVFPIARDIDNSVTVQFTAGYPLGNLPEPLRQAIFMLVSHFEKNRSAVTIGGSVSSMPFSVDALIANYRV